MRKHLDGYAGPENAVIANHLATIGGRNPAGYPNYRLVRSDLVLEKKGGNWHDWDENLDGSERCATIRKTITVLEEQEICGKKIPVEVQKSLILPGNAPIRVVAEIREIPKYSHLDVQGWILEKFFPAEMFGSQDHWYSYTVPGTTVPLLGPYPEDGVYEMIAGVFALAPSLSFLEQFIAFHKKKAREMQERDARTVMNEKVHRAEQDEKKKLETAELRILDKIKGPLLGTSLEAGRLRNEMAERAGIRGHMGN